MAVSSLLFLFTSLVLSGSAVFMAYKNFEKTGYSYLRDYLVFTVLFFLTLLFYINGIVLFASSIEGVTKGKLFPLISIINLICFPIIPFFLYFFWKFIRGLSVRPVPGAFSLIHFSVYGVFYLVFMWVSLGFFNGGNSEILEVLFNLISGLNNVVYISAIVYLFFSLKTMENQGKRDVYYRFNLCNCVMVILFGIFLAWNYMSGNMYSFIAVFIISLIPVTYLFLSIGTYSDYENGETPALVDFDKLCSAYNISDREKVVIRLIIDGKTNMEITDSLFIAESTVKKHIYNIYQKTNVKNRVQLTNIFKL